MPLFLPFALVRQTVPISPTKLIERVPFQLGQRFPDHSQG